MADIKPSVSVVGDPIIDAEKNIITTVIDIGHATLEGNALLDQVEGATIKRQETHHVGETLYARYELIISGDVRRSAAVINAITGSLWGDAEMRDDNIERAKNLLS